MRMPKMAVAAVALAAATSVALPAGAASAGTARGTLKICSHDGGTFRVYAEGPSVRTDDLVGEWDECTSWSRVRVGSYDVGYGLHIHDDENIFSVVVRTKRNGHVWYKAWSDAGGFGPFQFLGEVDTYVGKNQTTRMDIFVDA